MSSKPKIIDLFCGIGGMSLGFERAGFETVKAVDHWQDAVETYNMNRKKPVAVCQEIEKFTNEEIDRLKSEQQIDGVIGGPPCQGFSTVGTRNIDDPRNRLYREFFRVVKEVHPRFFVMENVKGLLTLNNGMFRDDILERFGRLGYKIQFKVLDAADYGVPQHRKRVFFVGVREGKFHFPLPLAHRVTTSQALSDLPSLDGHDNYPEYFSYGKAPENDFQYQMRAEADGIYNHNYTRHTQKTIDVISRIKDGGKISDLPREFWDIRKYNKSFQRMNSQQPSHTIDTGHRNYFHYSENRVPSVRECCRLQSFPDHVHIGGSTTSQYKQVGNAVPPLLAFHLATELIKGTADRETGDKRLADRSF